MAKGVTHPKNFMGSSNVFRPIIRDIDNDDIDAAIALNNLANVQRRTGPQYPEPPHASVPQVSATRAKGPLANAARLNQVRIPCKTR